MDCNIFNCHICSIEKFMRHFTETLATALIQYNCNTCGYSSGNSNTCTNPTCSNNPNNYPPLMANGVPLSCVCGLCTDCTNRLNRNLKAAKEEVYAECSAIFDEEIKATTQCECGAEASGSSRHSSWCPKFSILE